MTSWKTGLARLSSHLAKVSTVRPEVAKLAAEAIEEDMAATFAEQKDPNGRPWKKRKVEPKDGHPILDDTHALKDSRSVKADGNRIVVSYSDPKAVFHQEGTRSMPARRLLPGSRHVPKRWSDAISAAFKKAVDELFNS